MSYRIIQINELIKNELQEILYAQYPGEIVTVNFVNTKKDLSFSEVYFSVYSDSQAVYDSIINSADKIWKLLSEKVVLRRVPKLNFIKDTMAEDVNKIEEIISQQLKK